VVWRRSGSAAGSIGGDRRYDLSDIGNEGQYLCQNPSAPATGTPSSHTPTPVEVPITVIGNKRPHLSVPQVSAVFRKT